MAQPPTTDATEVVLAERHGPVLLLTLNRPERLNALNAALENRYFDLLEQAESDPGVRAVVLTGAGRGFCAGEDIENLREASAADRPAVVERSRPRAFPLTLRKPLIAAINGAAAGIGLVHAAYCDLRFATPEAKLTTAFARRGLVAECGISWLLPRLIGPADALDLLLSGRVVRGEEARRLGLVNRLVDPSDLVPEALAYAEELATHSSPAAMAAIKDQVQHHLVTSFAEAVRESAALLEECLTWPDFKEGVASYIERRPPQFPPLPARSQAWTSN